MDVPIKIFVEGEADEKFLKDYINHIAPDIVLPKEMLIKTNGWTNIYSQKENENGQSIKNQMLKNPMMAVSIW
jgi:hypothetical protein